MLRRIKALLLFLIVSSSSFPQIPINGFCKLTSYEIEKNLTLISTLNFNDDFYTDLAFVERGTKNFFLLEGLPNGRFRNIPEFKLPYEVAQIAPILSPDGRVYQYGFTSRSGRLFGLINFTKTGKPSAASTYSFKSFPENISTGDVNGDNLQEVLISGRAFEGLSVLFIDGLKISESKIESKVSYSHSILIDLTSNGFPDIAAYCLNNSSLIFFHNNGIGRFNKVREIKVLNGLFSLTAFDQNLDGFADIIFSSGQSIKILFGDEISSYDKSVTLKTKYIPHKVVVGDFNKDGTIEIAYADTVSGFVSVFFSKNESGFYNEVVYSSKENVSGLLPFYSRFIDGFVFSTRNGEVFTLTVLNSILSEVNLAAGISPGAINTFDKDNNGINDICFIDEYEKTLKLILRDNAGIPSRLFSVSIYENAEKIVVNDKDPLIKTFYLFSYDKKFIEIIRYDFSNTKFTRDAIYVPGPISDLRIIPGVENDEVFTAYRKNNKLEIASLQLVDRRTHIKKSYSFNDDFISVNLVPGEFLSAFYWTKKANEYLLMSFAENRNNKIASEVFRFRDSSDVSIKSIEGDFFNSDKVSLTSFVYSEKNSYVIFHQGKENYISKNTKLINELRITNQKQLFFGELKNNGIKKLCIYIPGQKSLYVINFLREGNKLFKTKIASDVKINNFVIKNLDFNNYHLIYTDPEKGFIGIKKL
ncbi:MAG: VCBS repeat-containing protein [Ignavibacteriaceae bacterium]|nr:VCBS repeat-containing protein [Ignavibacteriaceae bacterium]